ncbi:pre-rRNA-processing protein tsr1 [Anaeramoeba flamelloides]|uniref:Pre-rRNA-processing protein tsr1 n=1 Tax=Anaeramoeba flamelloides TaxID=1746091 RepID=A0AAV7ZE83_9EUKA|nr:pre-rRNA-processing protein tsr1 [Anaeramoeba flamelloides]
MSYTHRTSLKQVNKPFKGGSKRKKKVGGKITSKTKQNIKVQSKLLSLSKRKQERLNYQKQLRENKRQLAITQKRRLGLGAAPPKIVSIIPIDPVADPMFLFEQLLRGCEVMTNDPKLEGFIPYQPITVLSRRNKQRFTFICGKHNLESALELSKVSDLLLFMNQAGEAISELGELIISTIKNNGLPTHIGVFTGFTKYPERDRKSTCNAHVKHFQHHFDKKIKTFTVEDELSNFNKLMETKEIYNKNRNKIQKLLMSCGVSELLRSLSQIKIKTLQWREIRPYMLIENVGWDSNENQLTIDGYLRGSTLSVNGLLNIPDVGDFQMTKIVKIKEPCEFVPKNNKKKNKKNQRLNKEINMNEETKGDLILCESDVKIQESLKMFNDSYSEDDNSQDELDEMNELNNLEIDNIEYDLNENGEAIKINRNKNGNNYLYEEDGIESGEEEEEMEEDEDDLLSQLRTSHKTISLSERNREDMEFPDEMDTPTDQLAKDRFQRYRGLKSFLRSKWDPFKNLPQDYKKLFRFDNYGKAVKEIVNESMNGTMLSIIKGTYIRIYIKDATSEIFDELKSRQVLYVSGLLPYENKYSTVHFVVSRHFSYTDPIASKERFVLNCGFRRFVANVIFNEKTKDNQRCKYQRFFHNVKVSIMSVYMPIIIKPCPILLFKRDQDKKFDQIRRNKKEQNYQEKSKKRRKKLIKEYLEKGQILNDITEQGNQEQKQMNETEIEKEKEKEKDYDLDEEDENEFDDEIYNDPNYGRLVACGNLDKVDPDRLLIKKIILAGYIFRSTKRTAVIRYMFFYPKDVKYFKPIELWTKKGRVGSILKSLGSHGRFKATFDGVLNPQDTVCMTLYKRVFPLWAQYTNALENDPEEIKF